MQVSRKPRRLSIVELRPTFLQTLLETAMDYFVRVRTIYATNKGLHGVFGQKTELVLMKKLCPPRDCES